MNEQKITKVFRSGNSQAVRLPREFRVDSDEVLLSWEGSKIIITPLKKNWDGFMQNTKSLSEGFSTNGAPLPPDARRNKLVG